MPPLDFYKNIIFNDSWHQAEDGGFPRLMLLPFRFKTSSITTNICCVTVQVLQTGIHQLLHLPDYLLLLSTPAYLWLDETTRDAKYPNVLS